MSETPQPTPQPTPENEEQLSMYWERFRPDRPWITVGEQLAQIDEPEESEHESKTAEFIHHLGEAAARYAVKQDEIIPAPLNRGPVGRVRERVRTKRAQAVSERLIAARSRDKTLEDNLKDARQGKTETRRAGPKERRALVRQLRVSRLKGEISAKDHKDLKVLAKRATRTNAPRDLDEARNEKENHDDKMGGLRRKHRKITENRLSSFERSKADEERAIQEMEDRAEFARYESMLELFDYSDAGPSASGAKLGKRELTKSDAAMDYAVALADLIDDNGGKIGPVTSMAEHMVDLAVKRLGQINVEPTGHVYSRSWAYWNIARQAYASQHPDENTDPETGHPFGDNRSNPLDDDEVANKARGDMVFHQVGLQVSFAYVRNELDEDTLPDSAKEIFKKFDQIIAHNYYYPNNPNQLSYEDLVKLGRAIKPPKPSA